MAADEQLKNIIQGGVSSVVGTVQDAVSSGDYSHLSEDVGRELEHLFNNVGRTVNVNVNRAMERMVQPGQFGYRNPVDEQGWSDTRTGQKISEINRQRQQAAMQPGQAVMGQQPGRKPMPVLFRNMDNSSLLYTLGMVLGFSAAALALFFTFFLLSAVGWPGLLNLIIPLAAASFGLASKKNLDEVKRFKKYVEFMQGRGYVDVDELAAATGRKPKAIRRELKKMIAAGWFTQGHLDASESTLIASNELYLQSVETAKAAAQRSQEEQGLSEEQKEIFRAGEQYIAELRRCNDDIPDAQISDKLYRMEDSVRQIVNRARQKPTLTQELRRLMNYYLPTMIKLLHSYAELDAQEKSSANIEKSKREIENTIDLMNDAFDRLFDDLYDDTSLDIETDAEVMRTLLSREGLTGHNFGAAAQSVPGNG